MEEESLSVIYYGNIWRADLLKCLLEGQGIKVFLQDETLGKLLPWYTAPGGAGAVKVLVPRSEVEAARPIVDDFTKSEPR
jgi:putative signal transducing protein